MLSFNNIGNLGRLANQMFQYASLKGIARHREYEFSIPPREVFGQNDGNVKNSDVILYDVFSLEETNNVQLVNNPMLRERMHTFDEELFINCPDNVDLFGYFQTEKYFKHIEDDIRKDFTFNSELSENCGEFVKDSANGREVISLHIRRGDYVTNPNHPIQTLEYYKKALEKFPSDCLVLIFSDDFDWCNNQKLFDNDRFLISQNSSSDADMCMMTFCDYHIIANSSYSWWGAWLGKSKKTIGPKNWFGGDCVNKSIDDVVFQNFEFL